MRNLRLPTLVLAIALCSAQGASAQTLTVSLFERYLDALRVQAGIPGLSGAVLQNGNIVWEKGLGKADVGANIAASPDTPYHITGMSQALFATLLLRKCVDQSYLSTNDPVQRWFPAYADPDTSIGHLLVHAAPGGGFKYDASRFAALTPVIENCTNTRYKDLLTVDLFERLAMSSSVPGPGMATPTPQDLELFSPGQLARFADVLRRTAIPYRVASGKSTRSEVVPLPLDASTGIITTVRDLEKFDLALRDDSLLSPQTRFNMFTNVTVGGTVMPMGLGWFVQNVDGLQVVWHFGLVKDAWSSLVLKVPSRDLTFILLANSDGLSAPFALETGDVSNSIFAKLFLKVFAAQ